MVLAAMRAASFASCTEQIKNEKRYAQRIGLVFSMRSGYGIGAKSIGLPFGGILCTVK